MADQVREHLRNIDRLVLEGGDVEDEPGARPGERPEPAQESLV
jgi:hypothetical protein